jgi:predicted acylesterase/phospholipase RssA
MPRTVGERLSDWRTWAEQALHAGASWPAVFAPEPWVGALVGLWVGGQREYVEIRKGGLPTSLASWVDLGLDLSFSIIGGALWALL